MQRSRRQLLSALGASVAVGTAGCSAVDRVQSLGGGPDLPSGTVDGAIAAAIYEPGRHVDVTHRMLTVHDFASLRDHEDNAVAASLSGRSSPGESSSYDPESVETFAEYGPARLFAGTFDRESVREQFLKGPWTVDERYRGLDMLSHTEYPGRAAAGVGDGFTVTASRHRTVPPAAFVRAHADARAGEADRYRSRSTMTELLAVIGGGDYVSAITSPPEMGRKLPHSRAVGRSLEIGDDDITDTIAFYVDESAPESPGTYAERLAENWSEGTMGGLLSEASSGAQGRVAYFSAPRSASTFTEAGNVVSAIKGSGPTAPMQERLDERYTEEHGLELPGATFSYRVLDDGAGTDCGQGSNAVEIVKESGPAILARRLVVGIPRTGELYAVQGCGYGYDDEITDGDTIRIGFQSPIVNLAVLWSGPHGTRGQLPTHRQ